MEPYYWSWHDHQAVRLEGQDLVAAQQNKITRSARDISSDSILQFNQVQFHITSQSRPGEYYAIDI